MSRYGAEANIDCPACDRPTLQSADGEVVDWICGACGERITEDNDD